MSAGSQSEQCTRLRPKNEQIVPGGTRTALSWPVILRLSSGRKISRDDRVTYALSRLSYEDPS